MLTTYDIRQILDGREFKMKFKTRVVCGRNELPINVGPRPAVFIVNTLPTYDPRIGHWICVIFVDSSLGNKVLFFDPFGRSLDNYHVDVVTFIQYNSFHIDSIARYPVQRSGSTACGEYCLYFILKVIKGVGVNKAVERMYTISEKYMLMEMHKMLRKQ